MKLSEAIKLGSMLRPQAFGTLVAPWGSCALGAAGEASGTRIDDDVSWRRAWPYIVQLRPCPACKFVASTGAGVIVHLNDTHRWTRERIAEWVATIEPAHVTSEDTQLEVNCAVDPAVGTQAESDYAR